MKTQGGSASHFLSWKMCAVSHMPVRWIPAFTAFSELVQNGSGVRFDVFGVMSGCLCEGRRSRTVSSEFLLSLPRPHNMNMSIFLTHPLPTHYPVTPNV